MKRILLCLYLCLCGAFACHAQYHELSPKEFEILGIIRGAKKSMHVRTAGPISTPVIIELENRCRYSDKGESRRKLEVMAGDTLHAARLMRAGASVWVNKEFAEKQAVLIVDEIIVIFGFNDPDSKEIIYDSALAKHCIAELKQSKKDSIEIALGKTGGMDKRDWMGVGALLEMMGLLLKIIFH